MIQLYLALGLLGFLYYKKKDKENDTDNPLNSTPKIKEEFKSIPKKISNQKNETINYNVVSGGNKFNKTQIIRPTNQESFIDKQFGNSSALNSHYNNTKENFLKDSRGIRPADIVKNDNKDPNLGRLLSRENRMFQSLTGMNDFRVKKTESRPFFKPVKNLTHIHSSPNINELEKDRMNKTRSRKGELPFEKIQVGPGLGANFGNKPVGGFHQVEIQDIIQPKNIDQLRAKNNQRVSYKGVVIKGKGINKRTNLGKIDKRRPDKFYENSEDRYFRTTGSVLKDKQRLNFDVDEKQTKRTVSRSFTGIAKSDTNRHKVNPDVKDSTKNNYITTGIRNLHSKQTWSSVEKISDYGKHTFIAYANERDVTQQRTYKSNFNTLVKAIISPLLDTFKKTKKENVEGNIRPEGNLGMSVPKKQTVYDPNDIARTTIKETTIHNKHEGNVKVNEKNQIYKYDTLPKITIRNTLDSVDTKLNVVTEIPKPKQFSNQPIKATVKQTTIENKYIGQPQVKKNDGYKIVNSNAPNTNRQFTSNHEYAGIAGSKNKKQKSYDSSYNASLNINKERIAIGRAPTKSGPKQNIGGKDINIFHKKQMSGTKNRTPCEGIKFEKPQSDVKLTTFKDHSFIDNTDRIHSEILSPLEQNPYHIKNIGAYDVHLSDPNNIAPTNYTDIDEEEQLSKRIQEEIDRLIP